jgi:hypothetical protein
MKWPKLTGTVLICSAALLTGCSSVQLAYNNAPALLQFQMDRYLNLDQAQEDLLSQELRALQAWHREDELPLYAQTLQQWAAKLDQPYTFTASELLEKQAQLEQTLLVMGQESAYRLAPLILTLSESQRQRLQSRFDRANAKYARENLEDPEAAQVKRVENVIERYTEWLGELTPQQQQTLRQWLEAQPSAAQLWAQERLARQQALLQLLADAQDLPSAEVAAQELNNYFQSLSRYRIADLQAERESRQLALAELTATMLNSMTPAQRLHLRDKLLSYASDFEALSS